MLKKITNENFMRNTSIRTREILYKETDVLKNILERYNKRDNVSLKYGLGNSTISSNNTSKLTGTKVFQKKIVPVKNNCLNTLYKEQAKIKEKCKNIEKLYVNNQKQYSDIRKTNGHNIQTNIKQVGHKPVNAHNTQNDYGKQKKEKELIEASKKEIKNEMMKNNSLLEEIRKEIKEEMKKNNKLINDIKNEIINEIKDRVSKVKQLLTTQKIERFNITNNKEKINLKKINEIKFKIKNEYDKFDIEKIKSDIYNQIKKEKFNLSKLFVVKNNELKYIHNKNNKNKLKAKHANNIEYKGNITKKNNIVLKGERNIQLNYKSSISNEKDNTTLLLPNEPKGLKNFALNCYMNSLMQCLYNIKEIREEFNDINKFKDKKICKAFAEVINGLTYSNRSYYSVENLKEILGKKNKLFYGSKGADVTDLLREIIDYILEEVLIFEDDTEDNTNKEKTYRQCLRDMQDNIIHNIFSYFKITTYTCPYNHICYSFQDDTTLIFNLIQIKQNYKQIKDIYTCFDFYQNIKTVSTFNCSACKANRKGNSIEKLYNAPKILIIILDRGKGKQITDKILFYENLDLTKYFDKDYKTKIIYKFLSVSTHLGSSSDCGHYIAYCFRENTKKYYCFDDTACSEATFKELQNEGEPYILFYKLI